MFDDEEDAMGRRRRGVRRGDSTWTEILRRFEASGLSLGAFCRREGVAQSSLQRWRKRIVSRGDTRFVELVPPAAASRPSSSGWSLELTLPNGASLRIQG